jgi:NADH-quinone oxidoreductase subunit J
VTLNMLLVAALVLAALATVLSARLLRAVIGLAVTSAILAVIMFRLGAELAAVFELSVCAGLIPAIFVSTIGLTRRLTPDGLTARREERMKRYWFLPVLVILAGVLLSQIGFPRDVAVAAPAAADADVRSVLWNSRHLDLLGQIVILLAGAFGVVVLIKERRRDG